MKAPVHPAIIGTLAVLAVTGCARTLHSPYFYKSACPPELIHRFVDGDPIDKVGAAGVMADNHCTEAVPIILNDIKTLYATYRCDGAIPPSDDVSDLMATPDCHVTWKGKKVRYVDYHAPLFAALSRLTGVAYFEPDEAWYAALDRWVDAHLENPE